MKNITIFILSFFISNAAFSFQTQQTPTIDSYKKLIGKWEGTGFITDKYGLQQNVNATQWVSIKGDAIVVNGIFENNLINLKLNFLKHFYYSSTYHDWRMEVYVEDKYYLSTKLSLSDNYTLIYTFNDEQGILNRATIYAAFPYGWTEMLETWTGQTWDIKRRIIMRKSEPTVTSKSIITQQPKIINKPTHKPPY